MGATTSVGVSGVGVLTIEDSGRVNSTDNGLIGTAVGGYGTSLSGTFMGLDEGSVIDVDGVLFELSYGDLISAGSVTLTVIPEPGTLALIFSVVALGVVGFRRRFGQGLR